MHKGNQAEEAPQFQFHLCTCKKKPFELLVCQQKTQTSGMQLM